MASEPLIVVVGSVNVDLVVRVGRRPVPGETVIGDSFAISPGGKGANQAVAAARLGANVAMVGAVGHDEYAEIALRGLREAGVDLTRVATARTSTGIAVITVAGDADNSIVVVPGANATVSARAVSACADLLAAADTVIVQGEIPRDGVEAASMLTAGRLIVNLAPAIGLDPDVVRRANPLVVNEHEGVTALALLAGPATGARPEWVSGARAERATVRGLLDARVPSVVLTCGSDGAIVGMRGPGGVPVLEHVPALPVHAVDTTGAGDAFVGALGRALVRGDDLLAAARYATRVAAFTVRSAGAQPSYPDADDTLPGGD